MNKEEIEKMSEEERLYQLEWSDTHEFGTAYAYYLLDENKQLKELCDKFEEEHNTTFQKWVYGIKEQIELQKRIDKALEYINNCIGIEVKEELRKILKGDSNE